VGFVLVGVQVCVFSSLVRCVASVAEVSNGGEAIMVFTVSAVKGWRLLVFSGVDGVCSSLALSLPWDNAQRGCDASPRASLSRVVATCLCGCCANCRAAL